MHNFTVNDFSRMSEVLKVKYKQVLMEVEADTAKQLKSLKAEHQKMSEEMVVQEWEIEDKIEEFHRAELNISKQWREARLKAECKHHTAKSGWKAAKIKVDGKVKVAEGNWQKVAVYK